MIITSFKDQTGELTFNSESLAFFGDTIDILGNTIKQCCVSTDENIVSTMLMVNLPRTRKHVQALLDLADIYAKFIPSVAEKTAVLSFLLDKEQRQNMVPAMSGNMKVLFRFSPILKLSDYSLTLVIRKILVARPFQVARANIRSPPH